MFTKLNRDYYSHPLNLKLINHKNKEEKLKVGYIAHTLRSHSVGLLSRWLISHHDRKKFAIYLYLVCQPEDNITREFFRKKADQVFVSSNIVNDLVTQIEKDQLNILVDLDSFTNNLTSTVISLKPAPIQISWLGMDSNGIPAVDYFMVDNYVLPCEAQQYYEEKLWRLPNSYVAVDGFEIGTADITRSTLGIADDAIIYFNAQNALKRHPDIIHLQMKIIKQVPNSYLLIKGNGDQEILKQLFTQIAREENVDVSRLKFLPRTDTEANHRANLQLADIVLDTFPYNGATTTLETLWLEIPVVTKVGQQFAARNSYTFMINAGIQEGIAYNDTEYIEWGVRLGKDEDLRRQVSWKLRESKKTSPLWNGKKFTEEVEKAYRQMWQIYLEED